jgi:cAMP phosphodiesterase
LKQISKINSYLNQHPLYKERTFRFWINSFNDPSAPVDEILNLIVNSCSDMIPSEMVTLARYPTVVRNKEFNDYLRANYTEKLLTVYGFKLQDFSKNQQKQIIS